MSRPLEKSKVKHQFLAIVLVPTLVLGAEPPYPPNSVLVVATPGFEWAASDVSRVLGVRSTPVTLSLFDAGDLAKSDPNVIGVVEVELNLDQLYEKAFVICRDKEGNEQWREKRMLNFGGGRERLARDMVGALVKKVKGKKCPA